MGVESYKIILDLPSLQPALGFEQYAYALKEIIEESNPRFAIGIFGEWGSGKTTLMRRIEALLDSNRVIPVEFSAWRYEKEEHLIVPLLDTVREGLTQWADRNPAGAKDIALKTASTVGRVMTSILAGLSFKMSVPGALDVSYDANKSLSKAGQFDEAEREARVPRSFYHASFRALTEAFEEFQQDDPQRRIVVFVDDLDRCLPEGALEVLESMKLFFDLPGFVFVVGLNQSVVEQCIDARYRSQAVADGGTGRTYINGADYIKKIFQVPFALAPVSITQLDEFLDVLVNDANLDAEQRQDLQTNVHPHLEFLLRGAPVNPREIKRYINAYTLARKVKPHLDPNVVLALQTIAFRPDWTTVRQALYSYREVFLRALTQRAQGDGDALGSVDDNLTALPDGFIDYVDAGAPGNALLGVVDQYPTLAEYIYSGESTRSTVNPFVLDLFPRIAHLLSHVQDSDSGDGHLLSEPLLLARQEADEIRKRLSELEGLPAARRVIRDLQDLEAEFGALDSVRTAQSSTSGTGSPEQVEAAIRAAEAPVRRARNHLMDLL